MFFLGGPRLIYRMWKDHSLQVLGTANKNRALILGAGSAGDALIRDMKRGGDYVPIGLLDDNRTLKGNKIQGIHVYGEIKKLNRYIEQLSPDLLIIAMPSASNQQMQGVVSACESTGLPFRTLPRMNDLVSGKATLKELRDVAIEDLLGRDPVKLDWQSINRELTGKSILVTGGGGSIGSELCRQITALGPNKLIILENSEYNLYRLDLELQKTHPEISVHACLGDVTDAATVEYIFNKYKPAVVFHAAAYKHVPLLENQTREAVSNNIIGTSIVARTADKHNIDTFVLISTDKAVNPTNIMGTSKRVAEIFCQNLNERSNTRFITVRFGNVLGSAGSVVPLFKSQIEKGGPVTVTHPEIKRYFMTIPEACQLILQAGAMGKGGEIFVLDMGDPIKITYLAEQMIRLSGKAPGHDIEIVYTGLRPGEKLFEELFHENEELGKTDHDKILLAKYRQVDWLQLEEAINEFDEACKIYDETGMKQLLDILVPEHKKSENEADNRVINFDKAGK
jgi:FlaA1/EpsC-like NDP-sugar epimerase